MKSLLRKIRIRKAVGLYLGEHEVAVGKMASTPVGPVEIASASEPCTPENLEEVLERLLTPLLGRKCRVPVAVGMAGSRTFFGTRLSARRRRKQPRSRTAEGALFVEHLRRRFGRRSAARHRRTSRPWRAWPLAERGILPASWPPSAGWACGRSAPSRRPGPWCGWPNGGIGLPRRSKTALRVFLGDEPGTGGPGFRRPALGLEDLFPARPRGRFCHSLRWPEGCESNSRISGLEVRRTTS